MLGIKKCLVATNHKCSTENRFNPSHFAWKWLKAREMCILTGVSIFTIHISFEIRYLEIQNVYYIVREGINSELETYIKRVELD